MSAGAAILTTTIRVGRRAVRLTFQSPVAGQLRHSVLAEWSPDAPDRLNFREQQDFKAGMEAALAELAQMIEMNVAAVGGYDDRGRVL